MYRSLVGSIRYLVNTRLDLAFSIGYVSRFMDEPHEKLAVVKYILRYIAGTSNWGLRYARKKDSRAELLGFSDSDLTGDVGSRKSTTKVIFFLSNNPITWQSTKHGIVKL
ncbi:secreted RxLR effector protein 161-like [Phragmites australis]|uniref:secreted RxLR effector protein 161-like n=1 Tax=Phragmites australis TaxID=29695 RepID=UPI002D78B9A3|nr:secreted RxLR effector protein 161-like [Phragmites australis]